ncbi:MAG: hypothetical protein ABIK23_04220 [candidate division WOR-3 bacterium]
MRELNKKASRKIKVLIIVAVLVFPYIGALIQWIAGGTPFWAVILFVFELILGPPIIATILDNNTYNISEKRREEILRECGERLTARIYEEAKNRNKCPTKRAKRGYPICNTNNLYHGGGLNEPFFPPQYPISYSPTSGGSYFTSPTNHCSPNPGFPRLITDNPIRDGLVGGVLGGTAAGVGSALRGKSFGECIGNAIKAGIIGGIGMFLISAVVNTFDKEKR